MHDGRWHRTSSRLHILCVCLFVCVWHAAVDDNSTLAICQRQRQRQLKNNTLHPTTTTTTNRKQTRYAWDLDRDGFADIPSHPGRRFLHASVMEDMAKNPACRDTLEQELNRLTADVLDLKESASARTDSKRGADMW
jgi:hypothetical protein